MSYMKEIAQKADEICDVCGAYPKCEGCKILIKTDAGKEVLINGVNRDIIEVSSPGKKIV